MQKKRIGPMSPFAPYAFAFSKLLIIFYANAIILKPFGEMILTCPIMTPWITWEILLIGLLCCLLREIRFLRGKGSVIYSPCDKFKKKEIRESLKAKAIGSKGC
jgi:hypothetical protein